MTQQYSYRWAAKRVKNVIGLGMAVPPKNESEDAPEESLMRGGQKVNPHLMKIWREQSS